MSGPHPAGSRRRKRSLGLERGNAAVEMALLLPVLLAITFGAIDFARLFHAYITVASAAHETATYLAQDMTATDAELQAVATTESRRISTTFLTFGGASPNATMSRVTTLASGTTNTNMFVRVRLTYSFRPTVPLPLSGPLPLNVVADAPRSRALS